MARKRRQEEHENHERWLVSYADFITLLFAFFVVMYAISSVNEGKYRVLSDSLVNAFKNAPTSTAQNIPGSIVGSAGSMVQKGNMLTSSAPRAHDPKRKAVELKMRNIATDIKTVMEPLIKEGQVRMTETARGIAVEINASVLFASGQADLRDDSIKGLTAVGRVLSRVDNLVQVEGYTDSIPINSPQFPSNWELSAARASSVVRLFIVNGVASERLVAIGRGDTQPIANNLTVGGMARNRRVTVNILADSKETVTELTGADGREKLSPARTTVGTKP